MKNKNYKPVCVQRTGRRLGDYIKKVNVRNTDSITDKLLGINIDNYFMPSVANTIGTNLSRYKLVYKNQFACNRMHVGRDLRIPIAISKNKKPFMVSPAYDVFEIRKTDKLLPDYLMMWMKRPEFDRECAFHTDADVRGGLSWEDFCDLTLPIPSIKKQREIVADYQAVENKIKTNEAICEKLEETAQTIYRRWFEEFEFPCLPSDYRPHGQVNQTLPMDEYIAKIGSVCTYKRVGGLPISDGRTWFVYLILCEDDSIYKGMTNDLYRRFYEHYIGEGAEWTKFHKPLKVIHWESFKTKKEAAKREKDLKTGYGRTWIQRQIEKAGGIENLKTGLPAPTTSTPNTSLPTPKTSASNTSLPATTTSASNTSLPAPTTQLRTAGKMVWNEELEKEVPKGWEVKKIKDIAENVVTGKTPSTKNKLNFGDFMPFITIPDMHNKVFIIGTERSLSKKGVKSQKNKTLPTNTICVSCIGTAGLVSLTSVPSQTNQQINSVILHQDKVYFYFLSLKNISNKIIEWGTRGSVGINMNKTQFENIELICPITIILKNFDSEVNSIFTSIKNIIIETQKLHHLQSLLLGRMTREEKRINYK